MLGGTRRREGRRRVERTIVRKQGKGHGPCKPVNEMALDSRTGEEEEILDQRVTDGVASGQYHPPLHHPERISLVRNRMREICASGSVGGEGGNALAYPAYSGRDANAVAKAAHTQFRRAPCWQGHSRRAWRSRCGCAFSSRPRPRRPARSIIRAKPAVVNGPYPLI